MMQDKKCMMYNDEWILSPAAKSYSISTIHYPLPITPLSFLFESAGR
jgi:hypothetical protein